MPCCRIIVSGKVQGVGFRAFAKRQADSLDIAGWCRNLSTGEVEIMAKGAEEKIENLTALLRKGPPKARVDAMHVEQAKDCDEYARFEIIAKNTDSGTL
ncbi:MAG: acylphosphatase [Candidatus Aenigmarchaeota archaeon]|nr:acylphosphatase [Candidatus Aenigmarchaeota archaeon]